MLGGGKPRRLAGALFLPQAEQALFEPGPDRGVICRRVEELPESSIGVSSLVIGEHDAREVAELAIPLAKRQEEPHQRLGQGACQGFGKERLRVSDEADLAPAQTSLLPEKPHQAVRVSAGCGVTLPVGDQDEPGITRCDAALLERVQDLAGETIDEQRVGGIDGIVMDRDAIVPAAGRASSSPSIVRCQIFRSSAAGMVKRTWAPSPTRRSITRPILYSPGSSALPAGRQARSTQVEMPIARSASV